jgi:protein-disulfide isomerase
MGGACEKKPNKPNDTGAMAAVDHAAPAPASSATAEGQADNAPLTGIDLSKLDADKTQQFYRVINSVKSPCGKAHSLRTSFTSDTSCKRAPFAVRYVVALFEDEATETQAREEYAKKYENPPKIVTLDVSKAPHAGAEDARIRLVEFFDYECPHCALFKASMEQVVAEKGGQITASFLMFPLTKIHPGSLSAAQAAVAAQAQGKFKEMHDKLFEEAPRHSREDVLSYAKAIGLDVARFEKDYDAAGPRVQSDVAQGDAAGVDSTPTLFFNERKYEGPLYPKYLNMWIDEEIAVNR